ncbi:MAG: cytochrome d ubiquinol oxidase subunit II [Planctomycetes bacterium]|nr:cytochrome d ubiquinol oxidase subunit II [Planctomycetota bacterium]
MEELWFWLVSVMVAAYVVMDGFDFGAGALHLWIAKRDSERREVLAAIGPYWDGNEVWLLAAGGSLFLAFPRVLGAGFSGFYLAMFLVIWCLIGRACGLEFRSHVVDPLWRGFWDVCFAAASTLLPILFGAALGNVIRGVPIGPDGTFSMTLFTDFSARGDVGILDWYTVLIGMFALVALLAHGASFVAWKTGGAVHERALSAAPRLAFASLILWIAATLATIRVNPEIYSALPHRPLAWMALAVCLGGALAQWRGLLTRRPLMAFLGSCAFLLGILATTAACVFPVMLRSTIDPAYSLTALNSASSTASLSTGLWWWLIGFPIALGYIALLFRIHKGKVVAARDGEGY